jgi:hypothetical protein
MPTFQAPERSAPVRTRRFSDEMFQHPWPEPEPKPEPLAEGSSSRCPYCDQRWPQPRISITALFLGGVRRLGIAIGMILFAATRCIRLVIAAALGVGALFGYCCHSLALRIAHPHDRRFLGGK